MKLATIHFDGGGLGPGPVTAACTVQLSDGSFKEDVKRFDQGPHNIAEWQALILGLPSGAQARRAACGGQGRLDARGEADKPRVEDEE
jgi:hypothetical protein